MKTYKELSEEQRTKARLYFRSMMLRAICEGTAFFEDEKLQTRIDRAVAKAESLQTPWFAHEYVLEDKYIVQRLDAMATLEAEESIYLEDEPAVDLDVIEAVDDEPKLYKCAYNDCLGLPYKASNLAHPCGKKTC